MELCSRPDLNLFAIQRFRALICDKGLNLNCVEDSTGYSPLLFLCLHHQSDRDCEHIEFLLQSNRVDVNVRGDDDYTALRLLCKFLIKKNLVSILSLRVLNGSTGIDECVQLLRNRMLRQEAESVAKIVDFLNSGCSRVSIFLNPFFHKLEIMS